MKVTKHLLEQFISLQGVCTNHLLDELNKIGLEVESFYELKVPDKVVVGKVLSKDKHPDADKLSVCQVDIGSEVLQIVCGASNVDKNQWVAVAVEGARLQTPKGELLIKQAKLRGVDSCGMLCSSIELGFPKSNDGIMLLDESIGKLELGKALNSYTLFDNFVIELGLTPNRGDCLSVLGVARDLSVTLGLNLTIRNFKDENTVLGIGRVLHVINEGNFSSSVLYKVANLSSIALPLELHLSLLLCDLPMQNPLEDFLTYAMHNVGVILRTYPFKHFKASNLEENKAEILLRQKNGIDFVCGSHEEIAVGISPSKVQNDQEMLLLEASFIEPTLVSELIYQYKDLQKDQFITYRSTRGSNPDLLLGMQYLCELLIKFAQIDIYASCHKIVQEKQNNGIKTTFQAINSIIGIEIEKEEITNLLKKIGFSIEASFDDTFFMALPPLYRHDLQTVQDITEEILRFYRIQNISSHPLYFKEQSLRDNHCYFDFKAKRNLIKKAVALGFCETLHYVFIDRTKLEKLGFECINEGLDVLNPITNELNTLRTTLIPSMLESVQRNENFGFKAIALCESGICYSTKREEIEKLAFVVNKTKKIEAFPHAKGIEWDFYSFASAIAKVIGDFHLEAISKDDKLTQKLLHPYQSAWIYQNNQKVGYIGKLNPQSEYEGFACEVLLKPLLEKNENKKNNFSKFQSSTRDLTLMIEENISFAQIKKVIQNQRIDYLHTFYPLDIYKHESFGNQIALSIRFILQSTEKTLQEEDLNQTMQTILQILEHELGASLRQ